MSIGFVDRLGAELDRRGLGGATLALRDVVVTFGTQPPGPDAS